MSRAGGPLLGTTGQRALGVAAGLLLDRALGEPPDRWHPVAWFGTAMGRVEETVYRDSRGAGVVHAAVGAGLGAAAGAVLVATAEVFHGRTAGASRSCRHVRLGNGPDSHVTTRTGWGVLGGAAAGPGVLDGPAAGPGVLRGPAAGPGVLRGAAPVALAVGIAAAGRMLRETSRTIEKHLLRDDLDAARAALPSLVGRDPSGLDGSGVAAAVVESLAENTVDAVLAPAFWGLVAGAPGVLAHRAVNTMDAMVGRRNARYGRYGWASARLDDAMAWVPARALALLVALLTPDRARDVARLVCRDAPSHPSPNAGVAETAVAAALGVELGGPLRYGERVEDRPRLGDGPRPEPADIARARKLVDRAELVLVGIGLTGWLVGSGGRRVRAGRRARRQGRT